jgi:hypothetical protein
VLGRSQPTVRRSGRPLRSTESVVPSELCDPSSR